MQLGGWGGTRKFFACDDAYSPVQALFDDDDGDVDDVGADDDDVAVVADGGGDTPSSPPPPLAVVVIGAGGGLDPAAPSPISTPDGPSLVAGAWRDVRVDEAS